MIKVFVIIYLEESNVKYFKVKYFFFSTLGPPAYQNQTIISPTFDTFGKCNNGWICEHRWPSIRNMIDFRNEVGNETISRWWDNENNQIAFCRGERGFIAFNNENNFMNITLSSCLPKGLYCDVISGSVRNGKCTGKVIAINDLSLITITLPVHGVLALHTGVSITYISSNFTVFNKFYYNISGNSFTSVMKLYKWLYEIKFSLT